MMNGVGLGGGRLRGGARRGRGGDAGEREEFAEDRDGLLEGHVPRVGERFAVAVPPGEERVAPLDGGQAFGGVREARFRAAVAAGRAERVAEDVLADGVAREKPEVVSRGGACPPS